MRKLLAVLVLGAVAACGGGIDHWRVLYGECDVALESSPPPTLEQLEGFYKYCSVTAFEPAVSTAIVDCRDMYRNLGLPFGCFSSCNCYVPNWQR